MVKRISVWALMVVFAAGAGMGMAQEDTLAVDKAKPAVQDVPADEAIHVKRATFTNGIENREPMDSVDSLSTDVDKIFFFCEIVDMEGKTVTHRWIHNENEMAVVSFDIGGPRWRIYSSKKLLPEWAGTWTVEIADGDGNKLHEHSFVYGTTL